MSLRDFLDDSRFSRTFELPADLAKGRPVPRKLTYSDFGYRNEVHPEQEAVFLFYAPLMASRWLHVMKDNLAKKHKIRFIQPDRPGIGGSDEVDAKDRMTWMREMIPALLKHLGIKHVILGGHSGGTVFVLDFLLHHPELLDPARPYLVLGAPWVFSAHTNSTAMYIVQAMPAGLVSKADVLAKVMVNHVAPLFDFCSGISQVFVKSLAPMAVAGGSTTTNEDEALDTSEEAMTEEKCFNQIIDRVYTESVHGISSEALVLTQKVDDVQGWSDWGDYDALVPRLAAALRGAGRKLNVEIYYAEDDMMIGNAGTKGPQWFDKCWNAESCGNDITHKSAVVHGADHDFIWLLKFRLMRNLFEKVGEPVSRVP